MSRGISEHPRLVADVMEAGVLSGKHRELSYAAAFESASAQPHAAAYDVHIAQRASDAALGSSSGSSTGEFSGDSSLPAPSDRELSAALSLALPLAASVASAACLEVSPTSFQKKSTESAGISGLGFSGTRELRKPKARLRGAVAGWTWGATPEASSPARAMASICAYALRSSRRRSFPEVVFRMDRALISTTAWGLMPSPSSTPRTTWGRARGESDARCWQRFGM
eukprot:scaffold263053_cov32-Tisochrysis_lutea.AAC.3